MARHGENIRKRIDGRWEARYPIFDKDKGRKVYRSVYGSTYEEAKKKRADIIWAAEKKDAMPGHIPNGRSGSGKRIPFSQAAYEWLEEISGKRRHSTYVKYENIYKTHLEGISEFIILSDTPNQEFLKKISDHLSESSLSDSIYKSICCVTNQILAFAGRKYSVYVPVLKPAIAKSGNKPAKKSVEALAKAEQSRFFTCIYNKPDKFKIALLLCLYTGMRLGELCALRWTDFDFQDKTVTVNRTVQRIAVKGYRTKTILMETNPKSECSKRIIPLTNEIAELIKSLKGNRIYVFGEDKPLEPRTMQYRFKQVLDEANINDRNFHILRHTFATNCVESGMDVKTLSMILGHSDTKITLNCYVHPTLNSKRRQMSRLPDFYGQIRGQVA